MMQKHGSNKMIEMRSEHAKARSDSEWRLIRNPADTRQVVFAAIGPFVLVLPFLFSANIVIEIAVWLAVWAFICRHNYILHNHVHCPFMTSRLLNRTLGGMLGFCTGM